jgi:glycosyltransferase involved in cell wall biosynthesis
MKMADSKKELLEILHISPYVGRKSGGVGSVVLGFAAEQQELGQHPTIWCLTPSEEVKTVAQYAGLSEKTVVSFPQTGPAFLGYSQAMERVAVGSKGASFDILHQHGIWHALSRVSIRWRSTFNRPTIVAPHGMLETLALKRSALKKRVALALYETSNLKRATCLHATAFKEVESFRRFGLKAPIAIIPNGVSKGWLSSTGDADRFRTQFGVPGDRRLMLYLSQIHPIKGLPLLINVLNQLRTKLHHWILVIGGTNERKYQSVVQEICFRLDLTNKVRFVGPLFGQDKRDAFEAASLFVLPTHSENFGIVIAEALGAGVPVLTTRGAPWEELVSHRCGWWTEISVRGIGEALEEVLQMAPNELKEMGRNGQTLIAARYAWPRIGEMSLDLYRWLLGQGRRPDFVLEN